MGDTFSPSIFLHGKLTSLYIFHEKGKFSMNCLMTFLVNIFFQVSSWGGYVFLINLIPLHVLTLMATGRFTHRIYVAYSILYCIGTILSMQISFVGFQPVQSSEHMLVSKVVADTYFIFSSQNSIEFFVLKDLIFSQLFGDS